MLFVSIERIILINIYAFVIVITDNSVHQNTQAITISVHQFQNEYS